MSVTSNGVALTVASLSAVINLPIAGATIVPSSLSADTFTVSYVATNLFGQEMRAVSNTLSFENGENTIVFPENGSYTLTFSGVDEATNAMDDVIVYVTVDDRTSVSLEIGETYTYSASGFVPEYTASLEGDYRFR